MTAATPIGTARALTDLGTDGFRIVAVRGQASKKLDLWSFSLPDREIAAFKAARDDGTLFVVTDMNGPSPRLFAKVSKFAKDDGR